MFSSKGKRFPGGEKRKEPLPLQEEKALSLPPKGWKSLSLSEGRKRKSLFLKKN